MLCKKTKSAGYLIQLAAVPEKPVRNVVAACDDLSRLVSFSAPTTEVSAVFLGYLGGETSMCSSNQIDMTKIVEKS